MRLFHVSEDPAIDCFVPRLPARRDLDPTVGLVWAIDEARLTADAVQVSTLNWSLCRMKFAQPK